MRDRVMQAVRFEARHAQHVLNGRTNHANSARTFVAVAQRAPRQPGEAHNVTFRRVPAH